MTRLLAGVAALVLFAGCQPHGDSRAPGAAPVPAAGLTADSTAAPTADSTAVRDVLRRYYAAIEARDYRTAYAEWSQGGEASGQTYDQFASGFKNTAHTEIAFTGPVTFEGAAGSIFATVPVRIRAATTAGEKQEFAGNYELRRVNDVPGATPEQLRWHIHGAKLSPVQ